MKLLIYIISVFSLLSCVKNNMPREFDSPMKVPADFNWKTIESQEVNISAISTILNESGDTIASFMPVGTHEIITGKNTRLSVIEEPAEETTNTNISTKAINKGVIKEVVYFPSKNKYATIMFEDLFPYRGDMDMNDVVFGLNLELYLDNVARVRGFSIKIQPRAIGSSHTKIALAASLSSNPQQQYVDNISHSAEPALGNFFSNVTINRDGSYGPESGNRFDVIPITGDFRRYFRGAQELFLNVREIDPILDTETFEVFVELNSNTIFPISSFSFLGSEEETDVNLDIFALFEHRGREVHFKGALPTDYFYLPFLIASGTPDFSTPDNWVWAVMSDKSIRHPQEFKKIYNAYPNFKRWAESGGDESSDWHIPAISDSLYSKGDFNYIN